MPLLICLYRVYGDNFKKVIQSIEKHIDKWQIFLISLIEHKTEIEYNVCMQIFRYMIYIWEDYEQEMEAIQEGITRRKDFKYPPIC